MVMLEATRRWSPEAVFIFTSTNKVYGDRPNFLPLVERDTRWEVDPSHPASEQGIDTTSTVCSVCPRPLTSWCRSTAATSA
jgi:CDP-paratose 2-epimerase